ncbi:MAG TPA: hypothetical protein VFB58_00075 [Chloroflexota bacterium]|nr:hypothetical protein [Chloroflexota bacterium]
MLWHTPEWRLAEERRWDEVRKKAALAHLVREQKRQLPRRDRFLSVALSIEHLFSFFTRHRSSPGAPAAEPLRLPVERISGAPPSRGKVIYIESTWHLRNSEVNDPVATYRVEHWK